MRGKVGVVWRSLESVERSEFGVLLKIGEVLTPHSEDFPCKTLK